MLSAPTLVDAFAEALARLEYVVSERRPVAFASVDDRVLAERLIRRLRQSARRPFRSFARIAACGLSNDAAFEIALAAALGAPDATPRTARHLAGERLRGRQFAGMHTVLLVEFPDSALLAAPPFRQLLDLAEETFPALSVLVIGAVEDRRAFRRLEQRFSPVRIEWGLRPGDA